MSIKLGTGIGRHVGMVLIQDSKSKFGRWCELLSNHTTLEGLTGHLREGLRTRRWYAWKIVIIESEGGPSHG